MVPVNRLSMLALLLLTVTACSTKAEKTPKAGSATIIVIGKQGVAKTYLVSERDKVAALESMFPNYNKKPTSNVAAGWKAGFIVYFDWPQGESVRLVVSPTTHEKVLWTIGQGDFTINGDFAQFITELDK